MATKPKKVATKTPKAPKMTFGPCSERQQLALQDNTTDVILMGGGAGGGKSRVCITKNLDGIHDPLFRCAILRRFSPELLNPGGLVDESQQVYSHFTSIPYKTQAKKWVFPSGAEIVFSAISCDADLGGWQGSQLTRFLVDEAGDKWTEKQILFFQSRLRTVGSKIHPQLILTCNPAEESFLKEWVDFCLDPETGVPVAGTENRIRWFVVQDEKARWADSPEECFELYGAPKGLIYGKDLSEAQVDGMSKEDARRLCIPKSFRFIPTNVFDNPYLLPPRNTSYLASLYAQPEVNQLKYLHGSWTAKAIGASHFNRSWVKMVEHPPTDAVLRIRAWDLAAKEEVPNVACTSDYTVGVKMSKDRHGKYTVEDVIRVRKSPHDVLKLIEMTAHADGLEDCKVCIPQDAGAAGITAAGYYQRSLAENGVAVRRVITVGRTGKLVRFGPFCAFADSGSLNVVKADWNDAYFKELEAFDGSKSTATKKDDQVDATSDAFTELVRQLYIQPFAMPSFTRPTNIPTIN
jgi:predicted phage terminase large subunit-like protein